jgi:hypothetical protein
MTKNPADVLRAIAQGIADRLGLGVDHASFDAAAEHCGQLIPEPRPDHPGYKDHVRYRGWKIGWSHESYYWADEGWVAYKGGCDLGAPELRCATFGGMLDAIDDEEDE